MESIPDTFPSLFWGYTVIWVLLLALVLRMTVRLHSIEKKLKERK